MTTPHNLNLNLILGLIAIATTLTGWILFVIFGQVTVRKLRKNPATRDMLGFEWVSGLDIFQVASALTRPARLSRRLERGALRWYFADSRTLRAHTTRLDRILGRACYGMFWFSGVCTVIWMLAAA